MTDDVDQGLLLQSFGKASLKNLRFADKIRELEILVDALRYDVHHRDITIQALKDQKIHLVVRIGELLEKAETRVLPVVIEPEPILETDEFELEEVIEPVAGKVIRPFQGGNPPLIL